MIRKIVIVFASVVLVAPHARADTTGAMDAANYAQLVELVKNATEMLANARKQLAQLADVQRTIREAAEAYDTITTLDAKKIAADFNPSNYGNSKDKLNTLRGDLSRLDRNTSRDVNYYQFQMQRIANLESLVHLQSTASDNTSRAGSKTNPATDQKITAQSTSSLAALAAAEEQRRQREEAANAADAKMRKDSVDSSVSIYRAMGSN